MLILLPDPLFISFVRLNFRLSWLEKKKADLNLGPDVDKFGQCGSTLLIKKIV